MKRFLSLVFLTLALGGCAIYADPYPSAYVAPPSVYVQTPGVVVEPGYPAYEYHRGYRHERWYYRHG